MPGLGVTTDTDQPSVAIETQTVMPWGGVTLSGLFSLMFEFNRSGENTGIRGGNLVDGKRYVAWGGVFSSTLRSQSNVSPLVPNVPMTNIEVYTILYNKTKGTQVALPVHNPVVDAVDATFMTFWEMEYDTLAEDLYDDVRSPTRGPNALLLPVSFHSGVASQSKTAVNLEFTGSFSSEFEIASVIKSLHTDNIRKVDTRVADGDVLGGDPLGVDFVMPERAVHTGDPIFLESYVDITVDAIIPALDPIVMKNVPVRLVSNDTFDVTDKNGVKMDLTGTFEWIDNNGVEQSQTFPQSFTDTASLFITLKVAEEMSSASASSRTISSSSLLT